MIMKMFKKILLFALCFYYSFYSFAAVSVSDGSAFLTKSELQSDLNSLINRMALLESSLDAKIDSLVSAYLTRNGVWNGKSLDIDKKETHLVYSDFITSWNSNEEKEKTVWSKTTNIDKAGMCVVVVHIGGVKYPDDNSMYRCYLRYYGGTYCGFEDDVKVVLSMNEIIGGIPYGRNSLVVSQSQQRVTINPGNNGECIVPLPLNNDYVLLGFVSKDNTLQVEFRELTFDYQSGNSNITNNSGLVGGAYLNIYIKDCIIY